MRIQGARSDETPDGRPDPGQAAILVVIVVVALAAAIDHRFGTARRGHS